MWSSHVSFYILSNRVKPAVFDLFLAFGIAMYIFVWYLGILVSELDIFTFVQTLYYYCNTAIYQIPDTPQLLSFLTFLHSCSQTHQK